MPIYGTRPEAIKMAPLIDQIKMHPKLACRVAVTGQHRAMLDQVNSLFGIVPDIDLNIIRNHQSLNGIIGRTLDGLEELFGQETPDVVIVQGDTTTSTAAALAAFNRRIPVVHLEAGLRSGDLTSPFPEEGNRKITTQIASLHLAPTPLSRSNLLSEGVRESDIVVTGNTVIDALVSTARKELRFHDPRLQDIVDTGQRILLVTAHRRENHGQAMEEIGCAIAELARREPDLTVVFPIHKNPIVRESILPALDGVSNVLVTEPLPYGEFTQLLSRSFLVLTDSGGVQEEAPSLGKPVLVLRNNTERPEAVDAGTVRLVGTDKQTVVGEVQRLLHDPAAYNAMAGSVNPYGDGLASRRSLAAITDLLGIGERLPDFSPNLRSFR